MNSALLRRQIAAWLAEAAQALRRADWPAVRERAEAVLALDPGNTDAQALLAAVTRASADSGPTSVATPSATAAVSVPAAAPSPPASAPARSDLPASFAGGRYQVKRFLGEGGKKNVYLVHDTVLDRDVAFALIKTQGLDATGRARVLREARVMARLGDHPHIVPLHDLGEEKGQPFLVLPVMEGGDVHGLIGQAPHHRLPLAQALELARQVCRGLAHAHSRGVVHRDLKPGNVWLTAEGVAKVGDFGLALPLEQSRLTGEGMIVGTAAYMAPEQASGGEVTARADLYALGCMLYELVTGRPPFLGDDPVAVITQHLHTAPVAPAWHARGCPRELDALILRLLAKDPQARPAAATEVLAALDAWS